MNTPRVIKFLGHRFWRHANKIKIHLKLNLDLQFRVLSQTTIEEARGNTSKTRGKPRCLLVCFSKCSSTNYYQAHLNLNIISSTSQNIESVLRFTCNLIGVNRNNASVTSRMECFVSAINQSQREFSVFYLSL